MLGAVVTSEKCPEEEKKDDLEDLEAALKTAGKNCAGAKYFDKLAPLMQEDVNPRPAD